MLDINALSEASWDVVISGTGLPQSFLALALSRSGKRVLHIDKNGYYGGPDAAFSLQETEEWVDRTSQGCSDTFPFESASIWRPTLADGEESRLSFSRAYTISLSPQLIYSRSKLLPTLVSSKVYRQVEFQAVGSWWVYRSGTDNSSQQDASLQRVPSSREDVFADETMTMKSKRSLMKFLRFLAQAEDGEEGAGDSIPDMPFQEFLQNKYQVPQELLDPLLSLSLSPDTVEETRTHYAIPRVKRHLESIGVFGPGFGSLLAKWGGGAELCQVACRACAVGGGVYALNRGVKQVKAAAAGAEETESQERLHITLSDDEVVKGRFLVGSAGDLPLDVRKTENDDTASLGRVSRAVMIVSSPLEKLFPATAENGPIPAGAVVIHPGKEGGPPVYLLVHSSDTGECPVGQCILYGSVKMAGKEGQALVEDAAKEVMGSTDSSAEILWSLRYTQAGIGCDGGSGSGGGSSLAGAHEGIYSFPAPSLDLSFDDGMMEQVKGVWKQIVGEGVDESEFLMFEEREGASMDDDYQ